MSCKGQDGPQPRGPEKHQDPATKHSKRQKDQLGGKLRGQLWVPREVELRQKSGQLESGPAFQFFTFTQTARADPPSTLCGYGDKIKQYIDLFVISPDHSKQPIEAAVNVIVIGINRTSSIFSSL